jgi:3-dehydroquinate synthase
MTEENPFAAQTYERFGSLNANEWPDRAVLICERAVEQYAPFDVPTITVDGGESLKTLATIERLAAEVLAVRSTRPLTLVAMGGGALTDAIGFLASVLWRGVPWWVVPTTLLGAVDSAHGGKTAVNLADHKNQLGTFWPAERVIVSEEVLAALPVHLRAQGMTELVKALWLGAPEALDAADGAGIGRLAFAPWGDVCGDLMDLVDHAVRVKRDIVRRDPRETRGIRTVLNLGHTAGHALELACGASHGAAVAWGMAGAGILSHERGWLDDEALDRLLGQLHPLLGARMLLPDRTAFGSAIRADKKRREGELRSVLLRGAGEAVVVADVSTDDWYRSMLGVARFFASSIEVSAPTSPGTGLALPVSKSEANRAIAICALRGAELPALPQRGLADDTVAMLDGVAALRDGAVADAREGGTTLRFLAAVAAGTSGGTIRFGPQLGPLSFEVDASRSSQFVSALLLLRASRPEIEVESTGRATSWSYVELTEAMLDDDAPSVSADAGAYAFWRIVGDLTGVTPEFDRVPSQRQPDAEAIDRILAEAGEDNVVDVDRCADLVPVLAAYAALTPGRWVLKGAPQLRDKESDRVEDLARAFAEVGVEIVCRPDGVEVAAAPQRPVDGGVFDPRDDHRLVMAAAVLATGANIQILNPRCVAKSYPGLFDDLRAYGFGVTSSSYPFPDT